MTYKITNTDNPQWVNFKNFDTNEAAQAYVTSLGPKYKAVPSSEQVHQLSNAEKALADIAFGEALGLDFLTNEISEPQRTPEQVDLLSSRFMETSFLLEKGAIRAARVKLLEIPTDELFTIQDRDRYIAMIDEYLSMQYV